MPESLPQSVSKVKRPTWHNISHFGGGSLPQTEVCETQTGSNSLSQTLSLLFIPLGSVVRTLTGGLSLTCAQSMVDRWPLCG